MAQAKTLKARVLSQFTFDGVDYQPNDLFESDADIVNGFFNDGIVDTNKDAISYITSVDFINTK